MSGVDDDEMMTFTVIRTSDGKKKQLTLPLSKKLGELKQILSDEECFGPLLIENQRIFHLGREWKSQGRPLSKLGLGRFNNRVLHLQTRPDTTPTHRTRSQKRPVQVAEGKTNSVIDLLDDSDDEVETVSNNKRSRVS